MEAAPSLHGAVFLYKLMIPQITNGHTLLAPFRKQRNPLQIDSPIYSLPLSANQNQKSTPLVLVKDMAQAGYRHHGTSLKIKITFRKEANPA